MYVKYFDAPNDDVVHSVLVELDTLQMHAMLSSLPNAMLALLDTLPRLPESENSDFAANEAHRRALNDVIRLADFLIPIIELLLTTHTVVPLREIGNDLMTASTAFGQLQKAKEARIAITHRDLGEIHGSATAFQTFSYSSMVDKIEAWIIKENSKERV